MRLLAGIISLVACIWVHVFGFILLFFLPVVWLLLYFCMILSLFCMFAEDEAPGIWLLLLAIFVVILSDGLLLPYMLPSIGAGFFCMIYNAREAKSNSKEIS